MRTKSFIAAVCLGWACTGGGLKPHVPTESGDTDTDADGKLDAPKLDDLEPYGNDDNVKITGTGPGNVLLKLTVAGTTEQIIEFVTGGEGVIDVEVKVERGVDVKLSAIAVSGSGEESERSNEIHTEICDPPDTTDMLKTNPEGNGDTCGETHVWDEVLADDGDEATIHGNVHAASDEDWIAVATTDLEKGEADGFEDYRFEAKLTEGSDTFQMEVFRGGCSSDPECASEPGYDEYSFFMEDVEPDDAGNVPADSRACGDPPFNECGDWTQDFVIHITRKDEGFDCTPYTLEVSNGNW